MLNYDGFAVYQTSFKASASLTNQTLVLMAGRIDDLDEVYINGRLVGSTGDLSSRNADWHYREFRNYWVPEGTIKAGENTIEIKVYDRYGEGGILEGPVGFITQPKFRAYWRQKRK
jgi:sialate O-acetylesterase